MTNLDPVGEGKADDLIARLRKRGESWGEQTARWLSEIEARGIELTPETKAILTRNDDREAADALEAASRISDRNAVVEAFAHADDKDWDNLDYYLCSAKKHPQHAAAGFWIETMRKVRVAIRSLRSQPAERPAQGERERKLAVSDAMIDRALHAVVPGGAAVLAWLPMLDGYRPHPTAIAVMRAALTAALASSDQPGGGT